MTTKASPIRQTESLNPNSVGLDAVEPLQALRALHRGQMEAAAVVEAALEHIAEAASLAAGCLSSGGKLAYIGAGSSGLLAVTDGMELPGTFGIDPHQIKLILAGGIDDRMVIDSRSEDDSGAAIAAVKKAGLKPGDCAVLVSASGFTPFTVAALMALKKAEIVTIAIANNANARLTHEATVAIFLPTPPEILAGSTRLGAGTAQKIALNMFSTLVGMKLGHVHDGQMVNVVADNDKLKLRANGIVAQVAGCSNTEAEALVRRANGSVKLAILLAKGTSSIENANRILSEHGGNLRNCFDALTELPN